METVNETFEQETGKEVELVQPALAPAETAHHQRGDVCLPDPGRLELRPEGDQHQYRQLPDALDDEPEQLEA